MSESESDSEEVLHRSPAKTTFGGAAGSSDSSSDSEDAPRPKKKVPRTKKDPNAPKRSKSAYLLFVDDKRSEVKQAHPDWKFIDITKHMSAMWKDLPETEKAVCSYWNLLILINYGV